MTLKSTTDFSYRLAKISHFIAANEIQILQWVRSIHLEIFSCIFCKLQVLYEGIKDHSNILYIFFEIYKVTKLMLTTWYHVFNKYMKLNLCLFTYMLNFYQLVNFCLRNFYWYTNIEKIDFKYVMSISEDTSTTVLGNLYSCMCSIYNQKLFKASLTDVSIYHRKQKANIKILLSFY